MSLWSKPKRQLDSERIKEALETNFVKLLTNCYHILPLKCMFNDQNLDKCHAQIAAKRRVLEIALTQMEEVIILIFCKFEHVIYDKRFIRM